MVRRHGTPDGGRRPDGPGFPGAADVHPAPLRHPGVARRHRRRADADARCSSRSTTCGSSGWPATPSRRSAVAPAPGSTHDRGGRPEPADRADGVGGDRDRRGDPHARSTTRSRRSTHEVELYPLHHRQGRRRRTAHRRRLRPGLGRRSRASSGRGAPGPDRVPEREPRRARGRRGARDGARTSSRCSTAIPRTAIVTERIRYGQRVVDRRLPVARAGGRQRGLDVVGPRGASATTSTTSPVEDRHARVG